MINNDTMYGLYKDALSDKGRAILDSCSISEAEEDIIKEILNNIKEFHPEYKNNDSILNLTKLEIEQLRISKAQKIFLLSYINTLETIKNNKEQAKLTKIVPVTKSQFSFILKTFNTLLWKVMIEKAYVFKDTYLGTLYVECRRNENCKPKMNWKNSLINKRALEEKGEKPRIELEARTAEFNNEEYNGKEWIEINPPFNVIIKWKRTPYANLRVPTVKDFNMKLCRPSHGKGVITALKETRDNNKLDDLLIKYHIP